MNATPPPSWTADDLLDLGRSYQSAAVHGAAADLDLFSALARAARTADQLAAALQCDARGLTILLDALVALRLLEKSGVRYALPPGVEALLTAQGPQTILAMAQHHAHCLRNWAQLATVVKSGRPAQLIPSVRGQTGDQEAFIAGMHNISAPIADQVIQALQPLHFNHLLDIGGASGTWTIAFLRACPSGQATLFDLPHVIPMARPRLAAAGLHDRVRLVPGDFYTDALPTGADLAWVSAIVHQNSRAQNRALFARVFAALVPGGRIALRDVLMDQSRTRPVAGALFAVNMLVATEGGGTFTFAELREDLAAAGFAQAAVLRQDEAMNSVVVAQKPNREKAKKITIEPIQPTQPIEHLARAHPDTAPEGGRKPSPLPPSHALGAHGLIADS
jgi:precorrin-6B methylase 2